MWYHDSKINNNCENIFLKTKVIVTCKCLKLLTTALPNSHVLGWFTVCRQVLLSADFFKQQTQVFFLIYHCLKHQEIFNSLSVKLTLLHRDVLFQPWCIILGLDTSLLFQFFLFQVNHCRMLKRRREFDSNRGEI